MLLLNKECRRSTSFRKQHCCRKQGVQVVSNIRHNYFSWECYFKAKIVGGLVPAKSQHCHTIWGGIFLARSRGTCYLLDHYPRWLLKRKICADAQMWKLTGLAGAFHDDWEGLNLWLSQFPKTRRIFLAYALPHYLKQTFLCKNRPSCPRCWIMSQFLTSRN